MLCEEAQEFLSLYVDDRLTLPVRATCDEHLRECPVCRAELAETRLLTRRLSGLPRPVPPIDLVATITDSLAIEAGARQRQPQLTFKEMFARWLKPRLMPYTVGSLASLLLFIGLATALRPSMMALRDWSNASRLAEGTTYRVFTARFGEDIGYTITEPITAENIAAGRAPYGAISPSLNPRGALAGLTWSPLHPNDRVNDDNMVVVTDVFSDGQASLASIVQAPHDPRMLDDFQNALRKDPAFVPASFDRRPQTMRVVFVVQKVAVNERKF
jgi:hypothetical protein